MKKRIIAILGVITITLAGCANTETVELHTQPSVETIEETQSIIEEPETMTESEILSTEDTIEVSSVEEEEEVVVVNGFELVKEATVDLDGDGVKEEVSFDGKVLKMGEATKDITKIEDNWPWERFAIVDCDKTDGFLEIMIQFERNEGDIGFYRYDNGRIYSIGLLGGSIDNPYFEITGENLIKQITRMDVHQTDYVLGAFRIDEEETLEFIEAEEDYIYANYEKHSYELLEELPIYAEKSRDAEKTILFPQSVKFRSTDGKNWVEVVAEDETSGWMYVGELYTITDCKNKDVMEVFEGTGYAD